jgi:hypothetical protein
MSEEHLVKTTDLNFWKTTALLTWILIKLTLVAAMTNQNAVEFVYAGF